MNLPRKSIPEPARRAGFTLIELFVVLASVAILAVMLLPALAGTKPNSQAFQCLNNQRQIMLAWQMYAADNSDLLPPNDYYTGGNNPPLWYGQGMVINWVGGAMDNTPYNHEATNTLMLIGAGDTVTGRAALGPYNTNAATYHCPLDTSVVTGIGPRVRSVSMNSAVGTIWNTATITTPKGSPLGSTWLTGNWSSSSINNSMWRTYGTLGSMVRPVPSKLFVITDENPFSINDPVFLVAMGHADANGNAAGTTIIDTPASYHNGAVTISFADGHSEIHKWLGIAVKITAPPYGFTDVSADPLSLGDLQWLQARTTATK
jgi:prepilin-type processing-associated H-X9-DG protein